MKRIGLTIGINYPGSDHELSGCLADSRQWGKRLAAFDDVAVLEDARATKKEIVNAFKAQLWKAVEGDLVLVTYSGHGTIVPPGSQAIVPVDFDWNDPETWVTYDDIDRLLVQAEKIGVRVVLIFDSCHSAADPRQHMRDRDVNPHPPKARFLTPPPDAVRRTLGNPFDRNTITSDQDDILLAGCARVQTSADAWIDGAWHGAFSFALDKGIDSETTSYRDAVLSARIWLATQGYDQTPQACGAPEQLDKPFFR